MAEPVAEEHVALRAFGEPCCVSSPRAASRRPRQASTRSFRATLAASFRRYRAPASRFRRVRTALAHVALQYTFPRSQAAHNSVVMPHLGQHSTRPWVPPLGGDRGWRWGREWGKMGWASRCLRGAHEGPELQLRALTYLGLALLLVRGSAGASGANHRLAAVSDAC